ncbi:hypothetical protein LTR62_001156 [Meristemomyces frigidus]|uniref:C3H1-type domain-containing protein n=1 Tax=Meristemomyces frigidus TaxID=1508187 RepID=A0AAN7YI45_9PEZI|nr:hypothetical protein LTR62_001156 [Meristemomyces frigidus]
MAGITVEAGSPFALNIQRAAQTKLMENGWSPEESDTTLSEYVTMMLVNGKDMQGVQAELGGELLGVGEEDAQVADFTRWLFDEARQLSGQGAEGGTAGMEGAEVTTSEQLHDATMDDQMDDAAAVDGAPSGPKAMRNGSSEGGRGRGGRGGRMLGQMNRQMDRAQDDPLRRIKGAASGAGRIDGHAGRAPRGPRGGNVANGIQRMMNGNGRGGHAPPMNGTNPAMNQMPQDQQMMFMQMMEMQANMMASMMQGGGPGQMPNMPPQGGFQKNGGRGGKSMFERIDKRGQNKLTRQGTPGRDNESTNGGGMDLDRPLEPERGLPFDTMCKFNFRCSNPTCPFAHQSPANTRPNISLDMTDTCTYGVACQNNKCLSRHPSPALRNGGGPPAGIMGGSGVKGEVICRFYPNCSAGTACPFKHPNTRPCTNGADCNIPGCTFAHSTIACRYNPCTRKDCFFKHAEGQKRGVFVDKVWTSGAEDGSAGIMESVMEEGGKSGRFADLVKEDGEAKEELILPGQNENGGEMDVLGGQGNGDAAAAVEQDIVA